MIISEGRIDDMEEEEVDSRVSWNDVVRTSSRVEEPSNRIKDVVSLLEYSVLLDIPDVKYHSDSGDLKLLFDIHIVISMLMQFWILDCW